MPFIVGLGRSGTTLLRMMLDAHVELAIPPEQGFIPKVSDMDEERKKPRRAFFKVVTKRLAWNDCGIPPEVFEAELEKIPDFMVSEGIRCFYRLYASRFGKVRYGDKTPPYRSHMPTIERLLPEARFVHLIRDGRDVALSRKGLWFEDAEHIEDLASRWVETIRVAREHSQMLRHYVEVRYEDLITKPDSVLRRICDFIEIDYDPGMLRYYENAAQRLDELKTRYNKDGSVRVAAEQQRAILEGTTRPPDETRIGRWKQEMEPRDVERFEVVAGHTLKDLDYEVRNGAPGPPA